MPVISVIVPVYKAEEYLPECVDSVLAQTFGDFELILVDDGSPDTCPLICDDYAQRDSRVRVLHQKNQGQAAARNHALKIAQGEWICFVDSDDLIHPQMLELLLQAVKTEDVKLSSCGYIETAAMESNFCQTYEYSCELQKISDDELVALYDKNAYPCWTVWAKLIHRDIVLRHLFTEGKIYEDNAVVSYWFYEAQNVATMPHQMYLYRINPQSTTNCSFHMKRLDYLWALEEIIHFCSVSGFHRLRERFCENYLYSTFAYREKVLKELKRKDIAGTMKWQADRFLRKEKMNYLWNHKRLSMKLWFPRIASLLFDRCE